MSFKAIFRFENLDSTQDLNDRFKGLFKKGVYEGGVVKAGATGTTAIVEPFKAMSYDGMAVESDEDYAVTNIPMNTVVYIVLNAIYNIGENPTIEIKAVTESDVNSHPWYVKLAKRTGASSTSFDYLNDGCVDKIDPIGRNHFKGTLTQAQLEGSWDSFAKFDWCFVIGNQEMKIVVKDEYSNRAEFAATSYTDTKVNRHINNIVENPVEDSQMGYANSPSFQIAPLIIRENGSSRLCDLGVDSYGSYHITSNKWFAGDSITHVWETDNNTGEYTHNSAQDYDADDDSLGHFLSEYYDGIIHSKGTRFVNQNPDAGRTWVNLDFDLPNQNPNKNTHYITENYPLIPTFDEKWALVGNFISEDNKPSQTNRFLTQNTASVELYKAVRTNIDPNGSLIYVGKIEGKYVYQLNIVPRIFYYTVNINDYKDYFKPVIDTSAIASETLISMSFDIKKITNTPITTLSNLATITGSDIDSTTETLRHGNFLKNENSYAVVSDMPITAIYLYLESKIETISPALLNNSDSILDSSIIGTLKAGILGANSYSLEADSIGIKLLGDSVELSSNTVSSTTTVTWDSKTNVIKLLNASQFEIEASDYVALNRIVKVRPYTADSIYMDISYNSEGVYTNKRTIDFDMKKDGYGLSNVYFNFKRDIVSSGLHISGSSNTESNKIYFDTLTQFADLASYLYVKDGNLIFHTKINNVDKEFKVLLYEDITVGS